MNEVNEAMEAREEETYLIIQQIERLEEADKAYSKENSILKALLFMMCYNSIECTVFLSLQRLFDEIDANCSIFSSLTTSIQSVYQRYYTSPKLSSSVAVALEDRHHISFEKYSEIITTFSGNLDARQIRVILNRYGIDTDFNVSGQGDLLIVKNYRNKLAHGEATYNDVGRNFTVSDLRKICDSVFNYLKKLENRFSGFVKNKEYLQTEFVS